MASTPTQFQAIQNGVNKNSLVGQLYAGKAVSPFLSQTPAPSPFISGYSAAKGPMSVQPQTVASSGNVKSPSAPKPAAAPAQSFVQNPAAGANETVAAGTNTPGYSYTNGILSSVGGQSTAQPQSSPEPSTPVKKVTTNHSDGSSSTTEYHAPDSPQTTAGANQTPTYSGLVTSLAQNALRQSPATATAAGSLLSAPQQNNAIAKKAQGIQDIYGGQIANVGNLGAGAVAGDLSTGTNVVGSGNAAIASQSASQRMNALANDESQQLGALDRQLAAQGQGQSALTSAGTLGNTAQGQLQSGLTSAAAAAAPQQYGLTNQPYNPLSDSYGGGGAGGVLDRANLAGQVAGAQAAGAAPGNAQASNINTQGTATTDIAKTGLSQATQDYQNIYSSYNAADAQTKTLQNILESTGINATNSSDYNKAINSLKNRLGDSNFASFNTALQELQSMYSGLLSFGGGTPTSQEAQAISVLNPNSSAAQINASIQQLQNAANAKLTAQNDKVNRYQSALNGGSTNSSTNSNANSNPQGWF